MVVARDYLPPENWIDLFKRRGADSESKQKRNLFSVPKVISPYKEGMSSTTIAFGFAYLILGVSGFVLTGSVHKTALIPCVFGILFLIFGLLGRKESLRKHVMHAAVFIALLAFLGTARSLPHLPELFSGTAEKPAAIITQSLNAGFSILYIILAVRSFIQARRARLS
jgi:hypothetical protein